MNITDWLNDLTGGATDKDIAEKAGISARTLQHQTSTGKLSVENALKISVAYKRHPLRTLIDFDVVDASWAQVPDVQTALRLATDVQLTEEILRRLDLVDHNEIYDMPLDIVTDLPRHITHGTQSDADDAWEAARRAWPLPDDAAANDRNEEGATPEHFEP